MTLWQLYHPTVPDFLAEAAQTPEMQRLTDVGMNCGCEYTAFPRFASLKRYTRFDHSLGAALIVWHFTQDQTQAMAAFLHDIATPAFAHVIDFLRGDHLKQESTEAGTAEMILRSEGICRVCRKYGIAPAAVTDYHQYPIADNDAPQLSADRLEYTLSNAVHYGIITLTQAEGLYADLVAAPNEHHETELCFRHEAAALTFAEAALQCSQIYILPEDRFAMQFLSRILHHGIVTGIVSESDFYQPERAVIARLKASALAPQWEQFCSFSSVLCGDQPGDDGLWLQVPSKKRFIDPYITGIGRASDIFPAFAARLSAFQDAALDEWISAR